MTVKYTPDLLSTEEHYEGQPARLYRFRNGYGASIAGDTRYGWNIAVVRFFDLDPDYVRPMDPDSARGGQSDPYRWDDRSDPMVIDYSTPVTPDVVRTDGPDSSYTEGVLDAIAKLERY